MPALHYPARKRGEGAAEEDAHKKVHSEGHEACSSMETMDSDDKFEQQPPSQVEARHEGSGYPDGWCQGQGDGGA